MPEDEPPPDPTPPAVGTIVDDPELGQLVVIEADGSTIPRGIYWEDYGSMGFGTHVNPQGLYYVPVHGGGNSGG